MEGTLSSRLPARKPDGKDEQRLRLGRERALGRPYAALEMRRCGWTGEQIDGVICQNPIRFMSQSPKFKAPGRGEHNP